MYIIYHKETGEIKTITNAGQNIESMMQVYTDYDYIPNTVITDFGMTSSYKVNPETKELVKIEYNL